MENLFHSLMIVVLKKENVEGISSIHDMLQKKECFENILWAKKRLMFLWKQNEIG